LSETKTPTSDFTQAILNAQNNYWTLNFSSGFVLNDKTDLNLGYFFYQADNFEDNSSLGLPLGASAEEHGVTATLLRRISKNVRLSLKYGYYHYNDGTFGGHQDYYAHAIYSSLRYRF
jgi:outer membrane protein assembly factor BamA